VFGSLPHTVLDPATETEPPEWSEPPSSTTKLDLWERA